MERIWPHETCTCVTGTGDVGDMSAHLQDESIGAGDLQGQRQKTTQIVSWRQGSHRRLPTQGGSQILAHPHPEVRDRVQIDRVQKKKRKEKKRRWQLGRWVQQQWATSTYALLVFLACDDPEGQVGFSIRAKGWFFFQDIAYYCIRVRRLRHSGRIFFARCIKGGWCRCGPASKTVEWSDGLSKTFFLVHSVLITFDLLFLFSFKLFTLQTNLTFLPLSVALSLPPSTVFKTNWILCVCHGLWDKRLPHSHRRACKHKSKTCTQGKKTRLFAQVLHQTCLLESGKVWLHNTCNSIYI